MARRQVLDRRARLPRPTPASTFRRCPTSRPPLVVTGHQPELFHPGVWVKNFAAAAIAQAQGGVGLNLIVDNDIPKSTSIRVPRGAETAPFGIHRVEFDDWAGEIPYRGPDASATRRCSRRSPIGSARCSTARWPTR